MGIGKNQLQESRPAKSQLIPFVGNTPAIMEGGFGFSSSQREPDQQPLFYMKKCSKCSELKLLTEFKKDARRALGRGGICKDCFNAAKRQMTSGEVGRPKKDEVIKAQRYSIIDRQGYFGHRGKEWTAGLDGCMMTMYISRPWRK